jgi:TetR/AcrR family transcriptional repressor of nem operon
MNASTLVSNMPPAPRRRGRPRRDPADAEARNQLIRSGLEHLTERGYSAIGIDEILRHAGVPKGSFYHYFQNKEAFGLALIAAYQAYFVDLLEGALSDDRLPHLDRLRLFVQRATDGMARHDFRRGCLVGNLGQEMAALPESFRAELVAVFADWQRRTARCLSNAKGAGDLPAQADPDALAQFFWIGWEGAILRAKLEQGPEPIRLFADLFFSMLKEGEPNR